MVRSSKYPPSETNRKRPLKSHDGWCRRDNFLFGVSGFIFGGFWLCVLGHQKSLKFTWSSDENPVLLSFYRCILLPSYTFFVHKPWNKALSSISPNLISCFVSRLWTCFFPTFSILFQPQPPDRTGDFLSPRGLGCSIWTESDVSLPLRDQVSLNPGSTSRWAQVSPPAEVPFTWRLRRNIPPRSLLTWRASWQHPRFWSESVLISYSRFGDFPAIVMFVNSGV